MQIREALAAATEQLQTSSDSPRLDSELLLAHVLDKPRVYLMTWPEQVLDPSQQQYFAQLLQQRADGMPVAYLLGRAQFWSLELQVNQSTLIPRPETELLVEQALEQIPAEAPWQIADLGTGSGAIAIALATERPLCHITAVESSPQALTLARDNARRHGLDNIDFISGHWLQPLQGRFQMIVSNPPYIDDADPHLQQGDVRFEPPQALIAAETGLADLEAIISGARDYLQPPGWLLLEHGYQQGAAVRKLLTTHGYQHIETVFDLQGHPRVTRGCGPRGT